MTKITGIFSKVKDSGKFVLSRVNKVKAAVTALTLGFVTTTSCAPSPYTKTSEEKQNETNQAIIAMLEETMTTNPEMTEEERVEAVLALLNQKPNNYVENTDVIEPETKQTERNETEVKETNIDTNKETQSVEREENNNTTENSKQDPTEVATEKDNLEQTITTRPLSNSVENTTTTATTQPVTEAPTQAPTEVSTQAPTEAPTEAPTQAPVVTYTLDQIAYNTDAFDYFAEKMRMDAFNNINAVVTLKDQNWNFYQSTCEEEFKVMLALLNIESIQDSVLTNEFGNMTTDEFINKSLSLTSLYEIQSYAQTKLDFNNYVIDSTKAAFLNQATEYGKNYQNGSNQQQYLDFRVNYFSECEGNFYYGSTYGIELDLYVAGINYTCLGINDDYSPLPTILVNNFKKYNTICSRIYGKSLTLR